MTNNNIIPQIGDLFIFGRTSAKGNSATKVGPITKVINKRDGSKELKVRAFNSSVNTPVSYDNLVPVVAYVDASYLQALVNEGFDLQVIVPSTATVEPEVELEVEEEDCGCNTSACAVPDYMS